MSTPLVDWLRAQDDATLAALVRLRPDLTVPPPADLTVLATRAGVRASVHRACDDLDTPTLAVLEALVVADADHAPVPRAEVARLLGPDVPADVLDARLAALRARALVWEAGRHRDGPRRCVDWSRPARDVVSARSPAAWGARRPGVAGSSSALPQLLADVDAGRAPRARRPRRGPADRAQPRGRPERAGRPTARQGAAAARRPGDRRAAPPGRARAARRPAARHARRSTRRPLDVRDRDADTVDRTAGGAALDLLRRVETLIAFWGTHAAAAAPLGRPRRARPPPRRPRDRHRRAHRRAARRARRGRRPRRPLRRRHARLGAHHAGRRVAHRRPGDALVAPGPHLAGAPPAAGPRRTQGRRGQADQRPVRRRAPPAGPPRPPPRARRPRRAPARPRRGRPRRSWPTSWPGARPVAAGGCATRSSTWTLAEATTLGVVALDALSDPGRALLDRPRPARRRAARHPARPDRPRAAAGRPHGGRARPARGRAGARAGPGRRRRVRGRRHRLPVLRARRSAARSTRAAAPPTCTTCSPPARPPRCRRG